MPSTKTPEQIDGELALDERRRAAAASLKKQATWRAKNADRPVRPAPTPAPLDRATLEADLARAEAAESERLAAVAQADAEQARLDAEALAAVEETRRLVGLRASLSSLDAEAAAEVAAEKLRQAREVAEGQLVDLVKRAEAAHNGEVSTTAIEAHQAAGLMLQVLGVETDPIIWAVEDHQLVTLSLFGLAFQVQRLPAQHGQRHELSLQVFAQRGPVGFHEIGSPVDFARLVRQGLLGPAEQALIEQA